MKLKVRSRDEWRAVEMPLHANFRGLRIQKGSVTITPEELEKALNEMGCKIVMETLRNISHATQYTTSENT